ncbi:MAG: FHA domain-containing protein [Planctomycetota bacterium]|nr:FHA domain-containing protein [Planctomycetota bacterium]
MNERPPPNQDPRFQSIGPVPITTFLALYGNLKPQDFESITKGPFLLCQRRKKDAWLFDLGQYRSQNPGSIVLGRDPSCQIFYDGEAVSRRHAAFEIFNGQWFLKDLGASNGTFVDKHRLRPQSAHPLTNQVPIHFGPSARAIFLSTSTLFALVSDQPSSLGNTDLSQTAKKLSNFIRKKSNLHIGPFDLGNFAQKISKLGKDDFQAAFPCPALIRLQCSEDGHLLSREEETRAIPLKDKHRGFRRAQFWYLREEDDSKPFFIGRDPVHNDLVVEEADISRSHAVLTFEESKWMISDRSSTTGTRLNGQTVSGSSVLADESFVSLGGICILQFVSSQNFYEFLRRYNHSTNL